MATLKRNKGREASSTPSSATDVAPAAAGESKVQALMSQWKKLDENLSSFERLEAMRKLVAKGEMSSGAYDMLHDLAVSRATGIPRKQSVTGVTALEPPIMAGNLFLRSGKSWRKRYVLLFTERLEYHASKAESETNRGLTSSPSSLLILTEKFFVSDSSSRRLKNEKEHGFMVSDFVTTHYFAAETRDLAQYWMHTLAKTIKKIQEAKAFFDSRPKILGRAPKTSEVIEREYQERLSSYQSSVGNNRAQSRESRSEGQRSLVDDNGRKLRQSVRLKAEAADLEAKRLEHAAMQLEFEREASHAEEESSRLQQQVEEAKKDPDAERKAIQALEEAERRRLELEERALLEAKMVVEYEELVTEKQIDAAEAEAKEEIDKEIKRRSVAILPPNTSIEEIERILQEQQNKSDDDLPEKDLELKNVAIESVAKRVEEEQEEKEREAEEALQIAKEKFKEAEEAKKLAHKNASKLQEAMDKVEEVKQAQLVAENAVNERENAMHRHEALQRKLAESQAALERSRQRAAARMGQASKKPVPSPINSTLTRNRSNNSNRSQTSAFGTVLLPRKEEDTKIQAQIDRLFAIIARNPTKQISFGELCKEYEKEISNELESTSTNDSGELAAAPIFDVVGLLVRGKRQGLLD
jgi:hypothetical protein